MAKTTLLSTTKPFGKPNLSKRILIKVRQEHIDEGKCGDPNRCMIRLGTVEAVGIPHGYVKVDARGISITRRKDFRERAWLPNSVIRAMLLFDRDKTAVKPFAFWAEFHRTSRVAKVSNERREQVNENRRKRAAEGRPDRVYRGPSKRLAGIALTAESAAAIGVTDKMALQYGI